MTSDRPAVPPTVYKGHGTENDFVIIEDLDDELELTPALVRALCDRHAGIGGDGVLRVVRSRPTGTGSPGTASPEFFMDYRNADGSLAEMCGNGARVFVRYLLERGLAVIDGLQIATRAGVVEVGGPGDAEPIGWISVTLGPAGWLDADPVVSAPGMNAPRVGIAVTMPNPHVVVFVDPDELEALDLSQAPSVDPALPAGQNVEFVVRGDRALRMRVFERGVGETRSCGTGIAAAVVAASAAAAAVESGVSPGRSRSTGSGPTGSGPTGSEPPRTGLADPRPRGGDSRAWRVNVPGGTCGVRWRPDGHVVLSGPAVIVGAVAVDSEWWAQAH